MRFPLSAKILVWFFLNLVLLAAGVILLFNAQFHFDLNWVFASSARQRVEAVRNLIVEELNSSVPDEWDQVLERFSHAYHLRFSLYEHNGTHLIGKIPALPQEVRERFAQLAPSGRKPAVSGTNGTNGANGMNRTNGSASGVPSTVDRLFVRTTHPTQYWLLLCARLDNPQAGRGMKVVLVAQAESLSAGGLILDPLPWLWLAIGAVAFSVLFWLPLLRGISRSIRQLTQTTQQIAEGRLEVRIDSRRNDELGSLSEAINQMAGRLHGFVQGQKRFLGDIAHELCSPIARLQMNLGLLEQQAQQQAIAAGGEPPKHLHSAMEKAGQISSLVNQLLAFSKASFGASSLSLQAISVEEVVENAIQRETEGSRPIQRDLPKGLTVLADGDLLTRALANLLRNAITHGGEGPITIHAQSDGSQVVLRVTDSGPGVPEEDLARIFEAFFRVDPARRRETGGIGLGLAIVKSCIEACGGSVSARNRVPEGFEVSLRLPAA